MNRGEGDALDTKVRKKKKKKRGDGDVQGFISESNRRTLREKPQREN